MSSKYIIFDNEYAVCFHKDLVHKDVASMQHEDAFMNWQRKVPTSAGFFAIDSELTYMSREGNHWPEGRVITKVYTYGKSESLDISSDAGDKYLIAKALGLWLEDDLEVSNEFTE